MKQFLLHHYLTAENNTLVLYQQVIHLLRLFKAIQVAWLRGGYFTAF